MADAKNANASSPPSPPPPEKDVDLDDQGTLTSWCGGRSLLKRRRDHHWITRSLDANHWITRSLRSLDH